MVENLQGKSRGWFVKFFTYDRPSIDQWTLSHFVAMQVLQLKWMLNKVRNPKRYLDCVHTWCPSTSTQAPAQNGAVFRHWVPDISLPSSVPEYKVETLYSGTGTVPEFWRGYLKKWCVHISAHQESFSGTVLGHQVWTQPKSVTERGYTSSCITDL